MAEQYNIIPFRPDPGIKKDGTQTEGNFWNEGKWTRFYRGLPRSMGGYRSLTNAYSGPSRGLFTNLNGGGFIDVFSGSSDKIEVGQFTTAGAGSGVSDITPMGFVADDNNVWQIDSVYDATGSGTVDLVAHAAPNLADIGSDVAGTVYYGDITSISPLAAVTAEAGGDFQISGGIVPVHPYLVAYGSDGLVCWTDPNDPSNFPTANASNPTSTKIVKGISIRGNSGPAALLWSIDSVIQMAFTGGDTTWSFNTLSDQSSILSSSAVVEMDGVYFWPGIDRFLVFNGVLRELPNEMNSDFFYSNLNFSQRQKVFGFKIPRWGEIWWGWPKGQDATECNWFLCYNVRENIWYDTPMPPDGRSAAYFPQSWQYPVLSGATDYPLSTSGIQMWQHNYGTNEIIENQVNAIESFIVSPDISLVGGGIGDGLSEDVWTQLVGFEADFDMNNQLRVDIYGRNFAMDDNALLGSEMITPTNNHFDTQVQARYIRWKFTANEQDGFFVMGRPQFGFRKGDYNPGLA